MAEVIVDKIVSKIRAIDGISPETVRAIVSALLPAVREMFDHDKQVAMEKSVANGYVDKIERGSA
jgi:hypothetical protein